MSGRKLPGRKARRLFEANDLKTGRPDTNNGLRAVSDAYKDTRKSTRDYLMDCDNEDE